MSGPGLAKCCACHRCGAPMRAGSPSEWGITCTGCLADEEACETVPCMRAAESEDSLEDYRHKLPGAE